MKNWIYVLAVIGTALLISFICFQSVLLQAFHEHEGPNDVNHHPWLLVSMNGLSIFAYFALFSTLVLFAVTHYSDWRVAALCLTVMAGCFLIDIGLLFYFPVRLVSRCGFDNFDRIIKDCRGEFSDLLTIIKRGSVTAIMLGTVVIFHGLLIIFCVYFSISFLYKRKKQGIYKVNGRGNGYRTSVTPS